MKIKPELKDAPLNKYAFADQRVDIGVEEPNNDLETDLYLDLFTHVRDNTTLNKDKSDLIATLLKDKMYTDIFTPPNVNTLYRGMRVRLPYVEKFLSKEQIHKLVKTGKLIIQGEFLYVSKQQYKKSNSTSSWSKTLDGTKYFSSKRSEDEEIISITLHASTKDNKSKFFDLQTFYELEDELEQYKDEQEVMSVGQIKVNQIDFVVHERELTYKQKAYLSSTEESARDSIRYWSNNIHKNHSMQSAVEQLMYAYFDPLVDSVQELDISVIDDIVKSKMGDAFNVVNDYETIRDQMFKYWLHNVIDIQPMLYEALELLLKQINDSYNSWYKRLLYPNSADIDLIERLVNITLKEVMPRTLKDQYVYFLIETLEKTIR